MGETIAAAWLKQRIKNPFGQDGAIRWLIARQLHKRKDTCWASLVMWVLYEDFGDFKDFFPSSRWYSGVQTCRQDARRIGVCYCGKFVSKGFAEKYGERGIVVTDKVEPDDVPDLTTFTFPGENGG